MPQFERGLYEPGDDVHVFDASEPEEDVEGSRLPLLIVLALLVLAMFAGFVWLAYSEGVARGRSEVAIATAGAGSERGVSPGGAVTPYKGFKVYEQPAPPDDDAAQNVSPRRANQAASVAPQQAQPATPAAKVDAVPPVKMAAAAPVAKPTPRPLTPATAPPKPLAAMVPAKAPAKALSETPAAAASPGSGAYVIQIGAYKSQAEADAAWNAYKAKHAALVGSYSPDVARADLGDKGIWYRLRIAGFSSKDAASSLCDRLKADGGGCFLGK